VARADPAPLIDRWRRRPFNAVVVTSVDVFDALVELLGRSAPLLLDADLVVVSDRIGHVCRERGCRAGIIVAAGADDESILQSLGLAAC
jgi:uroporphyrinogen-III synthase